MKMLIGLAFCLACIVGGFAAMGGNPMLLWQPLEIVIILGGAVGGHIIGNNGHVLKESAQAIPSMFKKAPHRKDDYLELLTMLYLILRGGSKLLDDMAEQFDKPKESAFFKGFPKVFANEEGLHFTADYLRLIQLGTKSPHELGDLIDEEMETIRHELTETPNAMQVLSDSLPALGIVAAITGVVKAMGYINAEPAVLGKMIGGALVGTLYGILMSYCIFSPIAQSMKARAEARLTYYSCIKAALIAYLNGSNAQVCIEYARKVITSDVRPSFFEVDKAMQDARNRK